MVLQMAKELDAILDHGEANPASSCRTESGSVSFLEQIIHPIYETLAAVSGSVFQTLCCIFNASFGVFLLILEFDLLFFQSR